MPAAQPAMWLAARAACTSARDAERLFQVDAIVTSRVEQIMSRNGFSVLNQRDVLTERVDRLESDVSLLTDRMDPADR